MAKRTAKWEAFQDKNGRWRFHPKAANGEIIGMEGYESKQACIDGILAIREMANAPIIIKRKKK